VPRRQGALKKRKERQGFFRIKTGGYISSDWNHRFFVLQDKFLFYYDACGRMYRGSEFRGLISLRYVLHTTDLAQEARHHLNLNVCLLLSARCSHL
jgi:hypothetical protein